MVGRRKRKRKPIIAGAQSRRSASLWVQAERSRWKFLHKLCDRVTGCVISKQGQHVARGPVRIAASRDMAYRQPWGSWVRGDRRVANAAWISSVRAGGARGVCLCLWPLVLSHFPCWPAVRANFAPVLPAIRDTLGTLAGLSLAVSIA